MAEQNSVNDDRISEFWTKRAHDRGELSPELRELLHEYLNGLPPGLKDKSYEELQKIYLQQQIDKEERLVEARKVPNAGVLGVYLLGGLMFFPVILGPYIKTSLEVIGCSVTSGDVLTCLHNGLERLHHDQ